MLQGIVDDINVEANQTKEGDNIRKKWYNNLF